MPPSQSVRDCGLLPRLFVWTARRELATIEAMAGYRLALQRKAAMDSLNVEKVVRERYSQSASQRQDALCCPVDYDPRFLDAIPREVLERDYGC
ncbi:MAG: hypothetical protein JO189_02660, partial [Deltaproteobacteria bacterium]|nr:hypothetical protein [Deltaproteobacteria bacterium]